MFKKITVAIITVCLAFFSMYAASPIVKVQSNVPTVKKEVSDVPQKPAENGKTDKRTSRFLNMLNHNFVYGKDFDDIKTIVNNSCAALIDRIDDDGYINASYVENYLKNMYDISVDNIDKINAEFGYKEGFVSVIPRGYTKYSHELLNVTENEDGSFTVITNVTVDFHDSKSETLTAITVFIKSDKSMFGYNIVSSEIINGLCNA